MANNTVWVLIYTSCIACSSSIYGQMPCSIVYWIVVGVNTRFYSASGNCDHKKISTSYSAGCELSSHHHNHIDTHEPVVQKEVLGAQNLVEKYGINGILDVESFTQACPDILRCKVGIYCMCLYLLFDHCSTVVHFKVSGMHRFMVKHQTDVPN